MVLAGVPANYTKYDKLGGGFTDIIIAIKLSSYNGQLFDFKYPFKSFLKGVILMLSKV